MANVPIDAYVSPHKSGSIKQRMKVLAYNPWVAWDTPGQSGSNVGAFIKENTYKSYVLIC